MAQNYTRTSHSGSPLSKPWAPPEKGFARYTNLMESPESPLRSRSVSQNQDSPTYPGGGLLLLSPGGGGSPTNIKSKCRSTKPEFHGLCPAKGTVRLTQGGATRQAVTRVELRQRAPTKKRSQPSIPANNKALTRSVRHEATSEAAQHAKGALEPLYEKFLTQQGEGEPTSSSSPVVVKEACNAEGEQQEEETKEMGDQGGGGVTYDDFCDLLLDANLNNILSPHQDSVWQSMEHPLHHYWIESSHNTYLTGNQLTSDSSTEMYRKVLEEGCRCIEIDTWDGENDDPVVTHGMTRTSKIRFWDVIQAINKDAFTATPYPVILSLENHCCPKQCSVLASMMKEVFGEALFTLSDLVESQYQSWTPAMLQKKILVKWKIHRVDLSIQGTMEDLKQGDDMALEEDEVVGGACAADDDDDDGEEPTVMRPWSLLARRVEMDLRDLIALKDYRPPTPPRAKDDLLDENQDDEEASSTALAATTTGEDRKEKADVNRRLVEELCDLVCVESVKTKSWGLENKGYQVHSINERGIEKWIEKDAANLRTMSSRMCVRVYPAGWRVGSTNFNPVTHWRHGAQMIALNYQTNDVPMVLNRALFRKTNGGCGYILKPTALRRPRDTPSTLPAPSSPTSYELKLNVILGVGFTTRQNSEKIDAIASVTLDGSPGEMKRNPKRSTKAIDKNGYSPCWDEEFTFNLDSIVGNFLTFAVKERSLLGDKLLATATVHLGSCRSGLRCVVLDRYRAERVDDKDGNELRPMLLCNLSLAAITTRQGGTQQQTAAETFGVVEDTLEEITAAPSESVRDVVLFHARGVEAAANAE